MTLPQAPSPGIEVFLLGSVHQECPSILVVISLSFGTSHLAELNTGRTHHHDIGQQHQNRIGYKYCTVVLFLDRMAHPKPVKQVQLLKTQSLALESILLSLLPGGERFHYW